jgi:hypothetical protein
MGQDQTAGERMMTSDNRDDFDFFDYISDCLQNYDLSKLDNNQEDFFRYMDLCRNYAWDIPSAMPCDHLNDLGIDDFPMHHYTGADLPEYRLNYPKLLPYVEEAIEVWKKITIHFKDIHGLDLTDSAINWNFDT